MKVAWFGFIALALAACSPNTATDASSSMVASASVEAVNPPLPSHNYAENENGLYLYPEVLSEDQRNAGIAAAGFVAFKYLGFKNGLYYLQDENSSVIATCEDPCVVIRQTLNGQVINRVQFTPNTIIGAAFQDAINGQLNLYTQFKNPAETTDDSAVLARYSELNETCRGGHGDDPATIKACEQREGVGEKLKSLGYCYGEFATDGVTSGWSKCSNSGTPDAIN